jgi:hypothetical protein
VVYEDGASVVGCERLGRVTLRAREDYASHTERATQTAGWPEHGAQCASWEVLDLADKACQPSNCLATGQLKAIVTSA